ncbi:hypothetical protein MKW92_031893, partial [Papaver armeniacum]
ESEKNYVLDEDDYELLQDNNVGFHRPAPGSKKFKRLKKAGRDNDLDEHTGLSDNDEADRSGHKGRSAEEKIKNSLFDYEEAQHLEDVVEEEDEAVSLEEDDMDDFIVSEEEYDEHGALPSETSTGVSSSALQEAHDIFGDVDELLMLRKKGLKRRIEDEFEPFILSEKYMTEKDEVIRDLDVPERIQISEESTGSASTEQMHVEEQSLWIINQLNANMGSLFGDSAFEVAKSKGDVLKLLELMHVQKHDIPFIAMYRKELCSVLLKDPDQNESTVGEEKEKGTRKLKWHKEVVASPKRKKALQAYYYKRYDEESRRIYDETRLNLNQKLYHSIVDSLKSAESEREVDDVDAKFNLHFPPGEVGVDEGQFKRPKRKTQYSICSKAGLWEVASKIGSSSELFGLHLTLEKMVRNSLNFTCAMFENPQAVLRGARHMAAVELSCEPRVRKHVRNIFMEKAVVSTSPTLMGIQKPLTKFEDAQWLLILKAEEEKLIQVTLKLPEEDLNKLLGECNENYLSEGVSKPAKLWNEQRKMILEDTFKQVLPLMEKGSSYGKHLWGKVSVAPYQRKEADVGPDDEAAPRVLACCWGPGKPATTFVMLGSSGEVLDVLYAGSLSLRSQSVTDQQRKKNDQQRVLKFMTDHQPHVVVLGAVALSCTKLKEDIFEIIFKMIEEYPREIGQEMEELNVVYGDESLPRLYENSRISSDQLPGQPGIVRRAVALWSVPSEPLAMVATLCGPGKEILSWKLDSLDHFLTPDEKYDMVEQVMVDVINQVGIDINLAASHEWLFSPLQFISGLGPRKAASLQRELVRLGVITTRKELAPLLKRKVFINAAGFVRVQDGKDVFDADDLDDSNDADEDAQEMAIKHVREKPNFLKALDINEYARSRNAVDKLETLKDIKNELLHGFRDWRTPYREPDQDEEFYMISGETKNTIAEGRIVQATVRKVQPQRLICMLESGLTGWVMSEDYADHNRQIDLTEEVNEGDIITCKIKSIQKNRYQVYLTCKESELKRDRYRSSQNHDPYYKPDESSLQTEKEKARKEKELAKKHFKPRMIVHPRFQNITADDAFEHYPSQLQGAIFLTLTLKVYDGVYANKDIVEGGKDHKDITSLLRLGKTLKIGDDTFEDLDEVMDRYVDPLVGHLKTMLSYRKFKKGTKAEVDDLLRVEKSEYPMRIVYCFGISHEHPGTFILSYIRSTNPHHEYIGLYPKGFKFRKRTFEDIDRLVAYFQKHIDDLQHDSGPSIRSVAAMVPMRSPANGGSSGGWGGSTTNSNDGGWRDNSNSDRDRSSTPGSRSGRGDFRNGGGRDHPSGVPRPYGGGNNDRQDSGGWGGGSSGGGGSGWGSGGWDSPGGTKDADAMDTSGNDAGNNSGWGGGSKRAVQLSLKAEVDGVVVGEDLGRLFSLGKSGIEK